MAIVAKSVLNARRAAAAAAAAAVAAHQEECAAAISSTPQEVTPLPPDQSTADIVDADPIHPPRRRGHAKKDENGKWLPSDTGKGFGNPPVQHQFKPGGKGGPGRPKNSLSHDALLQKHLKQKREVSIGGRRQTISTRELLVMATVKAAVEGKDRHARAYALGSLERLFPSREANDNGATATALTESDALSLAEFAQDLRDQMREELREELKRELATGEGDGR